MGIENALNGLVYERGHSHCEIFFIEDKDITKIVNEKFNTQSIVVIWKMNGISWKIYRPPKTENVIKELTEGLEARIFNETAEIFFQREKNGFRGRFVKDGVGEPVKFVDSFSRFFGKKESIDGEFVKLVDRERKIFLSIPFFQNAEDVNYLGLTTRNYIGVEKNTGLSGYVDYRFLSVDSADYKEI